LSSFSIGWVKKDRPMSKRLSVSGHAAHRAGHSKWNGHISAMRWLFFLALISAILECVLPRLAGASESRSRSALANAPGLEKRVTYSETKIPLGELVAKVAADTGVPLTAARDVADEPVAVVVKEFSARELLEQLAELLDYHWSRYSGAEAVGQSEGQDRPKAADSRTHDSDSSERPNARTPEYPDRYEISQDLASEQREEALRRALSAGVKQRFQEDLALCRELAGKSQEEIQRLLDESARWNDRLAKLTPEERQELLNSPEGRKEVRRHGLARQLWSPIQRSLAGLMTRLTPEQWVALQSGRQLVFSSDPQRGKLPLPSEVHRIFRSSRPTVTPPGQPYSSNPEREEKARQNEREMQERWHQAERYDVVVQLLAFEACWWNPGQIQFSAITQPFRGGQRLGQQDDNPIFCLGVLPEKTFPRREEDPERGTRLEQDPVLSVSKPYQSDPRPYADPLFPGTARTRRLLPEWLPELARAYGVNFIADSYWNAPTVPGLSTSAGPRPLFQVLDGLTGARYAGSDAPFGWDRRGSLIRIRDQEWFLDRPREIPLRYIRRWVEQVDRRGALPLDEYAALASNLTDVQIETVSGLFQRGIFPLQLDEDDLEESRYLLRLYARLSPAQRQVLLSGQPLAVAQLAPALRPFVRAQLYRATRARIPMPDLDQWGGGSLILSRKADVRIREQRSRAVTFRLESERGPRPATRPDRVTRFPVMRLRWEIQYGDPTPAGNVLIVTASAPPE
jgi:hypothetical protein